MNSAILCKTLALSNQSLVSAVRSLGSLDRIFTVHPDELRQWFKPKDISRILNWQKSASVMGAYTAMEQALSRENAQILVLGDKDYPILLNEISDPPAILFIKGEISNPGLPQIAIVGSRNCAGTWNSS